MIMVHLLILPSYAFHYFCWNIVLGIRSVDGWKGYNFQFKLSHDRLRAFCSLGSIALQFM